MTTTFHGKAFLLQYLFGLCKSDLLLLYEKKLTFFYVRLITQCGQSWAFYTVLTEIPTYMANILHFNIQQNAILSALPYLTAWIFAIISSHFADWLLKKQHVSQLTSYKIWNAVASIVPAVGLLL